MNKESTNMHFLKSPIKVLLMATLGLLFLFVIGHVIRFLWNEVLVEATGVNAVSYWQAIGLFILARILFGGFRFGSKRKWRRSKSKGRRQRWMKMTDEERAEMKAKWKERCRTRGEADG